jgi:hypothetical protein
VFGSLVILEALKEGMDRPVVDDDAANELDPDELAILKVFDAWFSTDLSEGTERFLVAEEERALDDAAGDSGKEAATDTTVHNRFATQAALTLQHLDALDAASRSLREHIVKEIAGADVS